MEENNDMDSRTLNKKAQLKIKIENSPEILTRKNDAIQLDSSFGHASNSRQKYRNKRRNIKQEEKIIKKEIENMRKSSKKFYPL